MLGSPVWWYTIAPPVRTLLKEHDFTGKIVIPFATNAGWLGSTFKEIKSLCKGNVKNELSIEFSTDGESLATKESVIDKWLENIKNLK